jgi:zinc protease
MLIPLISLMSTASAGALPTTVTRHDLDNGLTIYLAPMDTPGVVAWQSWVGVGSKDEVTPGTTGFAHFFEHLMFYGSPELDREAREAAMLRTGADENAWTWVDDTVYQCVVATEALPRIIEIEADRFQGLEVGKAEIEKESGAVWGEYLKGLSSPWERTYDAMAELAFREHTYRHSTIGYKEDLEAMPGQVELVKSFFVQHYRPDSVRIVVAGDFDGPQVLELIEASYGGWSAGPPTEEILLVEPEQTATRRVRVGWDQGPTNPMLMMGWKVPGFSPEHPDAPAIALVSELLFAEVAPLYRQLVVDEARLYSLSGGSWQMQDPHLFVVTAVLKDAADLEGVEQAVIDGVDALRSLDEASLVAARTNALKRARVSLDTPAAVADTIGSMTRDEPDPSVIEAWYEAYAQVGLDDVQRVLDQHFVPQGLTVAVLDPEDSPASNQVLQDEPHEEEGR